ncbi:MAG: lactate utilization protein C [Betaproteobacteria bacterium]|nr:MAG: lactate utilization protein C [Betaproteobacteria bacterium]
MSACRADARRPSVSADGLADNRAARDRTLARVRSALGKKLPDAQAKANAEANVTIHRHGPRPRMPANLRERFIERARDMSSTVESIAAISDVPRAIAHYLDTLAPEIGGQPRAGVCWPEFATLDWSAAGLSIVSRPTLGNDRLGITGCFCAIAETGTIVITSGAATPTATAILPDTHVAIVRAERIVSGMEEAFALIRAEQGATPRALNLISGPSRTGDIEQTIVLGAHGPFRVHLLVVG